MDCGGMGLKEEERKRHKAKLSKPQELLNLCFISRFSSSPCTLDGHLKLPSWGGPPELVWC